VASRSRVLWVTERTYLLFPSHRNRNAHPLSFSIHGTTAESSFAGCSTSTAHPTSSSISPSVLSRQNKIQKTNPKGEPLAPPRGIAPRGFSYLVIPTERSEWRNPLKMFCGLVVVEGVPRLRCDSARDDKMLPNDIII
jgi:hypothetical protein